MYAYFNVWGTHFSCECGIMQITSEWKLSIPQIWTAHRRLEKYLANTQGNSTLQIARSSPTPISSPIHRSPLLRVSLLNLLLMTKSPSLALLFKSHRDLLTMPPKRICWAPRSILNRQLWRALWKAADVSVDEPTLGMLRPSPQRWGFTKAAVWKQRGDGGGGGSSEGRAEHRIGIRNKSRAEREMCGWGRRDPACRTPLSVMHPLTHRHRNSSYISSMVTCNTVKHPMKVERKKKHVRITTKAYFFVWHPNSWKTSSAVSSASVSRLG